MSASVRVGQVFEAKKPKKVGLEQVYNDREILWVSENKSILGHKDLGYSPEFVEWCQKGSFRSTGSILDQYEYESETGKDHRKIEMILDYQVQYNSPTVRLGANYPKMSQTDFLNWAGLEVTNQMPPEGAWRTERIKQTNVKAK